MRFHKQIRFIRERHRTQVLRAVALLFIILVLTPLAGCIADDEPEYRSLIEPGDRLPDFSVVMADGSVVDTESLRGGRSLILFFSTGCPDCRAILPEVQSYYVGHPEVRVVCIARSERKEDIEAYWSENHLTLPYSPQTDDRVYRLFATAGIPRYYLADEDLTVIAAGLVEQ